MATYKVIQDIEAEDKLVGPLTLRQFIYACVAAFGIYLSAISVMKGAAFLLVFWVPVTLFCAFFAFPWSRQQPTEIWALARIGFLLKPRKRIWNQSGIKELVTITAPKKIERHYTNGLSQAEVTSRLSALANTLDSRGWATKNINVNLYSQPLDAAQTDESDRLIGLANLPQAVPVVDVNASDDMLDEQNNPVARQFDQMITASTKARRQQLISQLTAPSAGHQTPAPGQAGTNGSNNPRTFADYWFLNQPAQAPATASSADSAVFANSEVVLPGDNDERLVRAAEPTGAEKALIEQRRQQQLLAQSINQSHLKTIQPLNMHLPETAPASPAAGPASAASTPAGTAASRAAAPEQLPPAAPPQAPVTRTPDPATIELARNNDLSVATIARIANKQDEPPEEDEVVISLR